MNGQTRWVKKLGWKVLKSVLVLGWFGVWLPGAETATAQWVSNGPPGEVITIAIDPQTPATLYAGTFAGGVFKSTNGGGNWTAINSGLTTSYFNVLAIDPQSPATLYAGSGVGNVEGGLFKSSNGGASWTAINSSSVTALAIDPQKSTTLYAGTIGVLKSSDGGGSWTAINNGLLLNSVVHALAIDPQTPTTLYAGTLGGGVFKSSNGGGDWTAINSGLTPNSAVFALAIDPQTPAVLYAGTYGGGVFKSSDGGANWTAINSGLTPNSAVFALAIDPQTSATLYAGTTGGVFKSTSGGGDWTAINSGLTNSYVSALAIDPQMSATLYAGTYGGGVFKSSDGGESWTAINSGLPPNSTVLAFAIDPQTPTTLYAGEYGVYKSADGGGSWTYSGTGSIRSDVYTLAIDPQTPTTLYAGTFYGGVFKSTDGGGSWISTSLTNSSVHALVIDSQTPATLYAGTAGGVFKSNDGGGSWAAINSGLPPNSVVHVLAIDSQTPATLYAGTAGGVFKSSYGGASWAAINRGLTNLTVHALAIDPQTPATLYAGTDGGGVFKSRNGGGDWTSINSGSTYLDVHTLALDPKNPSRIYAGTAHGGVFVRAACNYSISPVSKSYSSSGIASDQVNVTTTSSCPWNTVNNESWITIISGNSGSGNGVVTYSVSPNPDPGSRTGTIAIADQVLTVIQTGANPALFISSIFPNSGPVVGGTAVTIAGSGFQVGASVSVGSVQAAVSNVTGSRITATTGITSTPGVYDVMVTNPGGGLAVLNNGFTYITVPPPQELNVFVPIVLSASGMNNSFFTSEIMLTNKGKRDTILELQYTAAFGAGSGTGFDIVMAGQTKMFPDAMDYLRISGVPLPDSGNRGGTLLVKVLGVESSQDLAITVRTTTVVPEGRAGLAYAGVPQSAAFTGPVYLCGLRQNATDRSNVAVQNAGAPEEGDIVLRLTVFSADPSVTPHQPPDIILSPGGFSQISGILSLYGFSSGYVQVERINGTAPYYAYAVINDQGNSDGSFVPPLSVDSLTGASGLTLPVIVETSVFNSELVLTNFSSTAKTLQLAYVAEGIESDDSTARFTISLNAGQQITIPNLVQWLRTQGTEGIGPAGPTYAGPLFATVEGGDCSGIFLGARTATPGGGGYYGLFYTAVPYGGASTSDAWLYALQQNAENRTNLALVNTGENSSDPDVFTIELYDGITGQLAATVRDVTLSARGWTQINRILGQYASQVTQGYAHVIRSSGNNPFIAYAVINDGSPPGERSGDGAFIASSP